MPELDPTVSLNIPQKDGWVTEEAEAYSAASSVLQFPPVQTRPIGMEGLRRVSEVPYKVGRSKDSCSTVGL